MRFCNVSIAIQENGKRKAKDIRKFIGFARFDCPCSVFVVANPIGNVTLKCVLFGFFTRYDGSVIFLVVFSQTRF